MKHLECALGKNNSIWSYIGVLIASFFGASFIGSIPLLIVVFFKISETGDVSNLMDLSDMSAIGSLGISQNLLLFLLLLPLALGLFFMLFLIKIINGRTYQQVINGTKKIRWGRFWAGVTVWGIMFFISLIIGYVSDPDNYTFQLELSSFIPLLLISILIIPLQTSFEEVAFRGYMAQGIGRLTRSRWWVLIIPSVIFGLMHISNPEVGAYGFWLMMPQYILMGLLFGIVSILDDGIELALGIHASNNVLISLFTTHESSAFQTPAVFSVAEMDPVAGLVELVITSVVAIAIFYKMYNWRFSVLNKRVEIDETINESIIMDK